MPLCLGSLAQKSRRRLPAKILQRLESHSQEVGLPKIPRVYHDYVPAAEWEVGLVAGDQEFRLCGFRTLQEAVVRASKMNGKIVDSEKPWRRREPIYPEKLVRILETVWEDGQYPWSVRLKELVVLWIVWIRRRWHLTPQEERQLLLMSAATIDRSA